MSQSTPRQAPVQLSLPRRGEKEPAAFWISLTCVFALILIVYSWEISAGTMEVSRWPHYTNYSSLLADGFIHGHTWYEMEVPHWLEALPNPYDPWANRQFRWGHAHDMSLYKGHLYSYWGPVPALLIVAVSQVARLSPLAFDDSNMVFFFLAGLLFVSAAFMIRIRRRFFPGESSWPVLPCVGVAGLAAPVLCMMARPYVYEVAIAGGQLFLITGLLCAFIGIDGKIRMTWVTAAAIAWALAIGCRVSLAPAIAAAAALIIWRCRGRRIAASLCLGLPLTAAVAGLLYYNYVRFGSIAEFGVQYQLATGDQHALHSHLLFSWRFGVINLFRYLFYPPMLSSRFPFIMYRPLNDQWMIHEFDLPPYFGTEVLYGMLWCMPFLFFALAAMKIKQTQGDGLPRWLVICLAVVAPAAIFPALLMPGSTMRYFNDATPSLFILAAIGLLQLLGGKHRRATTVAAVSLATITIVVGLLVSVLGYNDHLPMDNRPLWRTLHAIQV
ncbi:MAG TPA: hypothetical protein VMD30_05345 [Tepidisphaeraceae bacterium]|nr:hypothetical protein [Tepidisphaeraceae bacterium]